MVVLFRGEPFGPQPGRCPSTRPSARAFRGAGRTNRTPSGTPRPFPGGRGPLEGGGDGCRGFGRNPSLCDLRPTFPPEMEGSDELDGGPRGSGPGLPQLGKDPDGRSGRRFEGEESTARGVLLLDPGALGGAFGGFPTWIRPRLNFQLYIPFVRRGGPSIPSSSHDRRLRSWQRAVAQGRPLRGEGRTSAVGLVLGGRWGWEDGRGEGGPVHRRASGRHPRGPGSRMDGLPVRGRSGGGLPFLRGDGLLKGRRMCWRRRPQGRRAPDRAADATLRSGLSVHLWGRVRVSGVKRRERGFLGPHPPSEERFVLHRVRGPTPVAPPFSGR